MQPLLSIKKNAGLTLVEVVISTSILLILMLIVTQIYFLIVSQITHYREQTVITNLSDQYMEVARNLPYSQIGTLSGNPHGNLADQPTPIMVNVNGTNYQIYYVVNYIDDPADGTILAGTDFASNDYKQVKLYVKNTVTNVTNSFLTNIVPKGIEGLTAGGALSVKVFDAVGQPVSKATINIINTTINPTINLTRLTDDNGNWIEVGLPNSSNSYHINVTKNGYSADQTYPISGQNPNPVKPDSTILNGQITQISFSIDKVSNLSFHVQNQQCQASSGISMQVVGAKLIGLPNVLKFDHSYSSSGSGQVSLNNIEWDSYTPTITQAGYMIYGTSPIQQISILPDTTQNFNVIIGPKTNNSLLVVVKDAATQSPVEGASVNLQSTSPSFDSTKLTNGSIWGQQDWSLGSGQTDFNDSRMYFSDNGNISTSGTPSGLRLFNFNGDYMTPGILTSSTFDTGTDQTAYTTLEWQPVSQNPSTDVKFQLAANNDNLTWDYLGPDGTASSYYTVSGTNVSATLNGKRYVRYKAFLSTQDTLATPVLTSVKLNYVSGCFTPGQAMFAGLTQGGNYQVVVNASGYESQTIGNLNVSGYNVLQVSLSH